MGKANIRNLGKGMKKNYESGGKKCTGKTTAGRKKRWKEGNGEAASYTPRETTDAKQNCVLLIGTGILLRVSSTYWTNSFISQL